MTDDGTIRRPRHPFLLSELAHRSGGRLRGSDIRIADAAGVESAGAGAIAFVKSTLPVETARASRAAALIVPPDYPDLDRPGIEHPNPRFAFAVALGLLSPEAPAPPGIDETARVADSAHLGAGCSIGPYAVIGADARLGDRVRVDAHAVVGPGASIGSGSRLHPHSQVGDACVLGERVTLFPGAVVGCEGFGFEAHQGAIHRLTHIGNVVIGNDVEVGALAAIDRGTTGSTTIGDGTKIDNLVMIGHNCRIGRQCLLAGQVGMAGSVVMGDGVIAGGDVSIADHSVIGDGVMLAGRAAVHGRVPSRSIFAGLPARDHKSWTREVAALTHLPDLLRDFRSLRREVERLKSELEDARRET